MVLPVSRRLAAVACVALFATPAHAASDDVPMVAIGMPFTPESPKPLEPAHPLYRSVEIEHIEGLPPTIKSSPLNFIAAAKRSTINTALRESFRRMNLLTPDTTPGQKRLTVVWKGSRTPFRIATSNATTVTFHYRLFRVDNGQLLFDRHITTSAKGSGVDASMRDNGIVRAAIAANFASAANCLDRAAYGNAPADCALTPGFSVAVARMR